MKRIIVLTISLILFISLFSMAFADDDTVSVPEVLSETGTELSDVENDFLSKSTSESDFEVRKAIINSVRSVAPPTGNESASDIYELLYSCWTSINLHYSLYVYDDQNYSVNNDIRTAINAIVSSLQGTTGSATGDIWNLLKQIINALTLDTNSNIPGDYTIHHNVDLISQFIASGLFDSNQNPFLQGISSNLTTVSSNLASQMNQIVVIRNKIDSIDSNVDFIEGYTEYISEATEMVLVPRIEHIDDDLHLIVQYLDSISNYNIVSEQTETITQYSNYKYVDNNHGSIRTKSSNEAYFNYMSNKIYMYTYIPIVSSDLFINDRNYSFVLEFPDTVFTSAQLANGCVYFQGDNPDSVDQYTDQLIRYNLYPTVSQDGHKIYLTPFYGDNTNLNTAYNNLQSGKYFGIQNPYIVCKSDDITESGFHNYNLYTVDTTFVRYEVLKHIDNDLHLGYDILNTFKELYASDDFINAKEEQQPFEDTVIEEFSGSGDASASIGDALAVGNISTTVKGAFTGQDGGTVSDALSVFDSSGDLYVWFSKANQNVINGVAPPYLRSSKGENDYTFIDDSLFNDIDYFADYKSSGGNYYD